MVVDCACKGRWREWGKMAHSFAIRQGKGISIALVIHSFDPCLREVSGSLSIVISKMESSFIVHVLNPTYISGCGFTLNTYRY